MTKCPLCTAVRDGATMSSKLFKSGCPLCSGKYEIVESSESAELDGVVVDRINHTEFSIIGGKQVPDVVAAAFRLGGLTAAYMAMKKESP